MPDLKLGGGGLSGAMSSMYSIDMGVHMVERFDGTARIRPSTRRCNHTEMTRLELGGVDAASRKLLESNAYNVAKLVPGRSVPQILATRFRCAASWATKSGTRPPRFGR